MTSNISNVRPNWIGNVLYNSVPQPFATITHSYTGTVTVTFRGTNGKKIVCNPGNGDASTQITLLGSTAVFFQYANSGTKRVIQITGDIGDITNIAMTNYTVSAVSGFSHLTSLAILFLNDDALLTASEFSSNTALTTLGLRGSSITDLSPLLNLINLNDVYLNGNPIVYTGYTWFPRTSGTFRFDSTVTTAGEVDQWLADLNAAGWSNCTIYLDGTNPAPTAGAVADIAGLVGRGCTVYTN